MEPGEIRSLPRNRKCGNCRHFEPAPLWRKGWCRNTLLYPLHVNHMVDSNTIDCEGGFRSRIYWEPLPEGMADPTANPVVSFKDRITKIANPVAPVGATFKPQDYTPEEDPGAPPPTPYTRLPEERDDSGWRVKVRERFPFTDNWPLEKVELAQLVLWGSALFLLLIALVVIFSNGNKKLDPELQAATAAAATQSAQSIILGGGSPIAAPSGNSNITPAVGITTTAAVSGATPATTTAASIVGRTGKVTGLNGDQLNVRSDPSTTAKVIARLAEGEKVRLLDGPKQAEGQGWYQIEVGGKSGWVSQKFIQLE